MGKHYPSTRYHPEKEPVMVRSAADDEKLGPGWYESPADFGVETCPGLKPDPVIAEKRAKFLAAQESAAPAEEPKKRGRPPKAKE